MKIFIVFAILTLGLQSISANQMRCYKVSNKTTSQSQCIQLLAKPIEAKNKNLSVSVEKVIIEAFLIPKNGERPNAPVVFFGELKWLGKSIMFGFDGPDGKIRFEGLIERNGAKPKVKILYFVDSPQSEQSTLSRLLIFSGDPTRASREQIEMRTLNWLNATVAPVLSDWISKQENKSPHFNQMP